MPLYSMTGFARVQVRVNDHLNYTISVKSVNHRFLDLQFRLPSGLDALEMELRKSLKDALIRGHVELTLSVDRSAQQKAGYNRELIANYFAAYREAQSEHGVKGEPDLNAVLRLPGAFQTESRGEDDLTALAASVKEQVGPLLDQLKSMRAREGEALAAILHGTMDRLAEATEGVAALRPEIEQRYQERLAQRLSAAAGPEFSQQRLLEEVAVLVERSDVS
jgi:uncharacterized protein (TIGR00255 family)